MCNLSSCQQSKGTLACGAPRIGARSGRLNKRGEKPGHFTEFLYGYGEGSRLCLCLNIEDLGASEGWLCRSRSKRDIVFGTLPSDSRDISSETCAMWQNGALQEYLNPHSPHGIFSADETSLFYMLLPSKTMTCKGDSCAGGMRSKERITFLVAANMTGMERLLVMERLLTPFCSKNICTLPAEYTDSYKA